MNMSQGKKRLIIFVFAAVALGLAGSLWSFSGRPAAPPTADSRLPAGEAVQRPLPVLDRNVPEKTKTALFALG